MRIKCESIEYDSNDHTVRIDGAEIDTKILYGVEYYTDTGVSIVFGPYDKPTKE